MYPKEYKERFIRGVLNLTSRPEIYKDAELDKTKKFLSRDGECKDMCSNRRTMFQYITSGNRFRDESRNLSKNLL